MRVLGRHWLVEYFRCGPCLSDLARVRELMLEAARRANATIVTDVFHEFSPHGVSGVVVIAESHLAIHTWPEYGCASVDIFSCGEAMIPQAAVEFLRDAFGAAEMQCRELERGRVER